MIKTTSIDRRWAALGLGLVLVAADRALAHLLGLEPLLPGIASEGALLLAWGVSHCDTLDGPVVMLARRALETGNVNHVLPWVRQEDESEIRHAFDHALAVRRLGPHARELADRHFFETLVRVHRASEGAPFTGLKPAGADLGPAVPAADKALRDGSIETVIKLLTEAVRAGVHRHFHEAMHRRDFAADDVAAGRRYVAAYVPYVHYVERLWEDATSAVHGHHPEHGAAAREHEHAAHAH